MKYQLEKVEKVKIIRLKEERLDTNVAPELKTLFLVWIKPDSANILIDLTFSNAKSSYFNLLQVIKFNIENGWNSGGGN